MSSEDLFDALPYPLEVPSSDAMISVPTTPGEEKQNGVASMLVSELTLPVLSMRSGDGSTLTQDIPLLFTPGKLFGRQSEIETLFRAYQKAKSAGSSCSNSISFSSQQQLVIIQGATGIGKTSLAQSLREAVLKDDGFFISGKFDPYKGSPPHDAFASAFALFCTQVLERGEETRLDMKQRILDSVGREAKVLTDMIPELEGILGTQEPPGSSPGNSEAFSRFKYVFRLFLEAVSSRDCPLVLFLDDLHSAGESSLDLLWSLLQNSANRGILFICTIRDDADTHLIDKQLAHLSDRIVERTNIQLKAFGEKDINTLITSTLSLSEDECIPLTSVVNRQTQGNVFFIVEFLRTLQDDGLLKYDKAKQGYVYDIEEIDLEFSSVNSLLLQRLNNVRNPVREMLRIASCLGTRLNEDALSYLLEEPIFKLGREATERGLLRYNHASNCFEFAHETIREVSFGLIPSRDREMFHYNLGRRLWKAYPVDVLLDNNIIFVIVGQLMLGCERIQEQRERSAVARLCLQAGMRAMYQSSFMTAYNYLMQGIQLLGSRRWYDDYQLCLGLHNFGAEAAYCTANFDSVFHLVAETFDHAKDFHDSLGAQATNVYALGSSGQMSKAIDQGLDVLKQLGVVFPSSLTWKDVDKSLKKTTKLLKGRSLESFLRLPTMHDPTSLAAMQMLNLIFVNAFMSKLELAPIIGLKMVEITLKQGLCGVSCIGFVLYAMLMCGIGDDINEGYRFGKLGIQLYEKSSTRAFFCRLTAAYYGCVHGWKRPVPESLEPLKQAHYLGIESGDIEFAMLNASIYCWSQLDYAALPELDRDMAALADRMKFYGQETNLTLIKPMWQLVHNMMGMAKGDPKRLIGEIHDETEFDSERFPTVHYWSYFHRMLLSYILGDYDSARRESLGCHVLLSHPFGAVDVAIVVFFVGLTNLALARRAKKNRKYIVEAEKHLKRISVWANHSPLNFLGKQYLLEAELAVIKGDHFPALAKYTSAVALSKEAGMMMQTALCNERAGKYFLSVNDAETGYPFLREATRVYEEWGGTKKVELLRKTMDSVADPSKQGSNNNFPTKSKRL